MYWLLILNAIIHPVCQKLFGYGQKDSSQNKDFPPIKQTKRLLHRGNNRAPPPPTDRQIYEAVCYEIEGLRRVMNPQKQFYIAIDGIAGQSKQTQQRQRRFLSAKNKTPQELALFDSNKITTGTEFMNGLSKFIHFYILKQLEHNPGWKHLEVIFSNEKAPGEGEHKIMRFLDKVNKQWKCCIYSPDADLIMLTLGHSRELSNAGGIQYISSDNDEKNSRRKHVCIERTRP